MQISHFAHPNDTAPESDLSLVPNLILVIASKYDCVLRLGSGSWDGRFEPLRAQTPSEASPARALGLVLVDVLRECTYRRVTVQHSRTGRSSASSRSLLLVLLESRRQAEGGIGVTKRVKRAERVRDIALRRSAVSRDVGLKQS